MKQHKFISILFISGLLGILTLSSFFRPQAGKPEFADRATPEADRPEGVHHQRKDGLSLSAAFENDYYTTNHRRGYYYAELKSDQYQRGDYASRRIPLNLSVVIDRSGSMAGDKIRNARQAAKQIVDQMSSSDYLSIVIYDGSVDVLVSATPVYNKQQIKAKIDGIYERGNTNLMGGALEGYTQVTRNYNPGYVNRVLLLSDGLANQGIVNPDQIRNIVRNKIRGNGISISTFGVGRDYNEDLMTSMAENGAGNYYFIDRPGEIASILQRELNELRDVMAQHAEMTIRVPDNVYIERVYGQEYERQGNQLVVNFNDIFSNETKGVLVRYSVKPGQYAPVAFSTSVHYTDVGHERRNTLCLSGQSEYTSREYIYGGGFNEWVTTQIAIYESNERLEEAMKEVDRGNYDEAKRIIKKNKEYLAAQPEAVRSVPAVQKAVTVNADYDSKVENVESLSAEDVKFIQKDTKNSNYRIRAKK